MLKPTPIRLIYLVIGLLLGAAIFYAIASVLQLFGPRAAAPPPIVAAPQFTGTSLERVLPVAAQAERNGTTVRLNSLEMYSDGLSLTYSVVTPRVGAQGRVLDVERLVLTDDRGTVYAMSPFVGSSSPTVGYTAGYLAFSPAIPPESQTLRVSVPNLLVIGTLAEGEPRVIDGPWEFQIPVR